MNKKKLVRNVSLVALSAVMMAGSAAALAACNGGGGSTSSAYALSVNIFCDSTDAETNKQICNTWAAGYTEKLRAEGKLAEDQSVTVNFRSQSDRDAYFTALGNDFVSGRAADIVYVQPKNVKSWAQNGRIMNLADLITATEGQPGYEQNVDNIQGLWQDVLSFYGYSEEAEKAGTYQMGDTLAYTVKGQPMLNGETADHDGFYTAKGTEVGVYGLPKDYSNFTMGFNGRYFSDALKYAYQTVLPSTDRSVKGALNFPAKNTYTGKSDAAVVTYAVTGDYKITNPLTGAEETIHAEKGQPARLINIGVPVYYKPYNFYAFASYDDAVKGNDPVAKAVIEYTKGKGYLITMPGFPGDTFAVPESAEKDPNAPYDSNIGHITLTYAEYGALTWAITYFCNTFNFREIQDATSANYAAQLAKTTKGTSGVVKMIDGSSPENVYGNDQYEGAPNPTLYLLPWLAGNDANFINLDSNLCVNMVSTDQRQNGSVAGSGNVSNGEYTTTLSADQTAKGMKGEGVPFDRTQVADGSRGGTISEPQTKLRINGKYEDVDIQYGCNSENFIETFGAFLAYGSDWNGNSGYCRSEDVVKQDNGWELFRQGACIFYGAGTWDNKTKNESSIYMNGNGETITEWRTMTVPVGEKYSLASWIKDGFYEMVGYGAADASGNLKSGTGIFTQDDIIANQMTRQDKWGARMDSVGYALNDNVRIQAESNPEAAWKLQGAADLIMTLTADKTAQHDLCLGGAQLPNFRQQCVDLLNYQKEASADSTVNTGSFADMVTPEGFATTKYWDVPGLKVNADGAKEADQIWRAYVTVVEALELASRTGASDRSKTFRDWFDENYPTNKISGFTYQGSDGVPLRWDEQFANMKLGDVLTGEKSHRAAAMKVLKMVTYTYADRDMMVRMQYGLNAVRDSAMYTFELGWINDISTRSESPLCYRNQQPITGTIKALVTSDLKAKVVSETKTPAFFCFFIAQAAQGDLELSIFNEAASLNS